ncbi:MAG: hypothetical protein R3B57_06350 [Phycisphaerales bacterium]
MGELKRIHSDTIPRAISKAERYRLLNEPWESESICRDILAVEPDNQEVLALLVLAITDQFARRKGIGESDAEAVLSRIKDPYRRAYYGGVIAERWAKRLLRADYGREVVLERLHKAMDLYDEAQRAAPEHNEDAVLRWNTCVRLIERFGLDKGDARSWDLAHIEHFDDEMPTR